MIELSHWVVVLSSFIIGAGSSLFGGLASIMLIYYAISRGVIKALSFAGGVWLSDLLIILVFYTGVSTLEAVYEHPFMKLVLPVLIIGVGGVFIITLRKSYTTTIKVTPGKRAVVKVFSALLSSPLLFVQGFVINLLNPGAYVLWLTGFSMGVSIKRPIVPPTVILTGLILTDLLKIWAGNKLVHHVSRRKLRLIRGFLGLLLVVVGFIWLVYELISLW